MKVQILKAAMLLATAIGTTVATPAVAQMRGAGEGDPEADSTADRSRSGGSEIVVTARRRDELLQDVPISITVYSQDQLDDRNVVSGADLAAYTPSLTANSRFGANNTSFAIRGFTQELRTTASVAVYFADVVAPRGGNGGIVAGDGAGPGSFFDLQNVQVLKGPQGTLFGRNTTGGAVLLVPQMPTDEFEGYIEGSYGDFDMTRLQGVVNVPLADMARLRLGADYFKRDGYIDNISGIGPDKFGDSEYIALRGSLSLDLTPTLENYTIASYSRSEDNGPIQRVTDCAPTSRLGFLACPQVAAQAGQGFYTVQNGLPDPKSVSKQWQVINTTTWLASDELTVKNIVSYAEFRNQLRGEIFGTLFRMPASITIPLPNGALFPVPTGPLAGTPFTFAQSLEAPGTGNAAQYTFTEELQLQGNALDGALDWQVGAYYEQSKSLEPTGTQSPILLACSNAAAFQCSDPLGMFFTGLARQANPAAPPVPAGSLNFALGQVSFRNVALYGQATYDLTENLSLTGGLRYTWDKTTAEAQQVTYRFFAPNQPVGFCTLTQLPTTSPANCVTRNEQSSNAPTWLINLDYKPTDAVLLYAKYARGYRQGAVNYSAPTAFQTFGPEKVDTYEIGAKFSLRGPVPGYFNIAAFHNDFSDQQLAVNLVSSRSLAAPTQAVINAGSSTIKGIEIDTSISPFEGFQIGGSYAYLDTNVKSLTVPPAGAIFDIIQPTTTQGSRLTFTPDHEATLFVNYTLPVPEEIGEITFGAVYTYRGDYRVVSGPFGVIASNELVNLNASWKSIGGSPIDLSAFVTNLTNEKYFISLNDQISSGGFVARTLGMPRMFGMRLRYTFGG